MKDWVIPMIGGLVIGGIIGYMAWYDTQRLGKCEKYHYETYYRGYPPASWEQKVCDD